MVEMVEMSKIKENKKKNKFLYIGIFIILFYSFFCSLLTIHIKQKYYSALYIIALFFIAIGTYEDFLKKKNKEIFIETMAMSFIIIFRNADINHGIISTFIFNIVPILSLMLLSSNNSWNDYFIKLVRIFTFIHIVATFFCFLFPNIYLTYILPLYPDTRNELMYQFNHKQVAGITQHYSTNALYLVIGLIFNSIQLFYKGKSKKIRVNNIIIYILNTIALLLTGKRGMVLYYIISAILMLLIINKGNIFKTIWKLLPMVIGTIILISILSISIPSITNPFTKILEATHDESVFNSREILWNEAKELFKRHPIFGIGWGDYKYEYNLDIINKEREYMQVHCIYLQVLCETGVVGFTIFVLILLRLGFIAFKDFRKFLDNKYIFVFLMFYNYFILEGITGNPIYDIQIYISFYMTVAMFLNIHYLIKNKEKIENEKIDN